MDNSLAKLNRYIKLSKGIHTAAQITSYIISQLLQSNYINVSTSW